MKTLITYFLRHLAGIPQRILVTALLTVCWLLRASVAQAAAPTVTFSAVGGNPQTGADFTVPVKASGFTSVSSFQFSLQWDPAVIQFVGLGTVFGVSDLNSGSFNTNAVVTAAGKVGVLWEDTTTVGQTVANGTTLFEVKFRAIGANGTLADILFGSSPTAQGVVVDLAEAVFAGVKATVIVGTPENPVINWAAPSAITYGTALSATQLAATTTAGGTLTYDPPAGTVLGAGAKTLTVLYPFKSCGIQCGVEDGLTHGESGTFDGDGGEQDQGVQSTQPSPDVYLFELRERGDGGGSHDATGAGDHGDTEQRGR